MDMDTSHHWLAFSLSHHPCFLEPFSSPAPAPLSLHHGGEMEGSTEEEASAAAELAALAGMGPKLENFLGGPSVYSGEDATGSEGIYDSDLKTIAAGFLRGYSAEDYEPEATKEVAAPPLAPADSKKSVDTFGQRTSIYRGVTRHRWTGRYEAHLWDNSCRREGQSRKGRQVYLGGYDKEEKAARAYDLAALKYWGPTTTTNSPISNYEKELEEMKNMTRQEFVASLRRKSSGFSRGASMYRGVTRHHQHGRWQARIGRVAGNKDLYLGTFSTQEEAAEAYDIAAIKFRGLNAVTNFDISRYDVKSIMSSCLPVGGRTTKPSESPSSSEAFLVKNDQQYWSLLALQQQQQQQQQQQSSHGFGQFPSGLNMDFGVPSDGVIICNQAHGIRSIGWNNDGIMDHQQKQEQSHSNSCCSMIPYATPMANINGGIYNYDGSSYMGTWVTPTSSSSTSSSSLYYQASKPNVAVFQTPIFGIE